MTGECVRRILEPAAQQTVLGCVFDGALTGTTFILRFSILKGLRTSDTGPPGLAGAFGLIRGTAVNEALLVQGDWTPLPTRP